MRCTRSKYGGFNFGNIQKRGIGVKAVFAKRDKNLEVRITEEKDKTGKSVYKAVKLTPEEVVRQLYLPC